METIIISLLVSTITTVLISFIVSNMVGIKYLKETDKRWETAFDKVCKTRNKEE